MPRRSTDNLTVTLTCPECGPVVAPADEVAVECGDGIARSVGFTCPGCGSWRSVPAAASGLALLHRAGVARVDIGPTVGSDEGYDISADRQVVSLRVLLDDPEFLTRLAGQRTLSTPTPAVPGAEQGAPDPGRTDA
jgi:hypothetical protein